MTDTGLDRLGLIQRRRKGAVIMNTKICRSGEWVGGGKCFEVHIRKKKPRLGKVVSRNVDIKSSCSKVSDGKEEYVISHWMKGELCYKLTKN